MNENREDSTTPEVEHFWGDSESEAVMLERMEITAWQMNNIGDWGQDRD